MICYHLGSEKLKVIPKKVELVEAVKDIFKGLGRSCADMEEWGVCCNK